MAPRASKISRKGGRKRSSKASDEAGGDSGMLASASKRTVRRPTKHVVLKASEDEDSAAALASSARAAMDDESSLGDGMVSTIWCSKLPVRLIGFDQLPAWLKDNEYIRSHYRPPLNSFGACALSLGYVHNETCNVYSHIIGVLIMISLTLYGLFVDGVLSDGPPLQILAMFMFIAGSSVGMTLSFLFHLFDCHSQHVHALFARLDYAGISIMIAGSFVPSVYHAFYCTPHVQVTYMVLIWLFGIACTLISLLERFATPEYRTYRMSLFLFMGLSGIVPGLHTVLKHGSTHVMASHSVFWHLTMGTLYVFGAVLYGLRFPERFAPGRFDIVGHSHTIFHVCVVLAACAHYRALLDMKSYFATHECPA